MPCQLQFLLKGAELNLQGQIILPTHPLSVYTVAELKVSCNAGAIFVPFALDDFYIHKARAQIQELQVVSDDSCQVLVVPTISVPVKVGRIFTSLPINEGMSTQFLRNSARCNILHHGDDG